MIVPTHGGATCLELDPYIQSAFSPCRPKVIFIKPGLTPGMPATPQKSTADPKERWTCSEALRAAGNETAIRFLALDCFPDEHKGIIAVQGLRFNREDCEAFAYLKELGVDGIFEGHGVRGVHKQEGSLQPPAAHLSDILAHITAAKRWITEEAPHGHAEWVWLTSEPEFDVDAWRNEPSISRTIIHCQSMTSKLARYIVANVFVPRLAIILVFAASTSCCCQMGARSPSLSNPQCQV